MDVKSWLSSLSSSSLDPLREALLCDDDMPIDKVEENTHISRFIGWVILRKVFFSEEFASDEYYFYSDCLRLRFFELFSVPMELYDANDSGSTNVVFVESDASYYKEMEDLDLAFSFPSEDKRGDVNDSSPDSVELTEVSQVEVEPYLDFKLEVCTLPDDEGLCRQLDWKAQTHVVVENVLRNSSIEIINSMRTYNANCIQDAIDEVFPHHFSVDDRYFQTFVETSDIDLELDAAHIDMSKFPKKFDIHFDWEPKLSTGLTSTRYNSFREAALAIKKRNLNVPDLTADLDVDSLVPKVMERFLKILDLGKLSGFPDDSHDVGCFLLDYLSRKGLSYDVLEPGCMVSLNKYRHMIKSQLKPVEEDSLHVERPLAATITYHGKEKVSVTTPFFLSLAAKLLCVLSDKVVIPMGKEHQLFDINVDVFRKIKFWKEIDYSKFDKSQGKLHHEIQRAIFRDLQCDEGFLSTWFHSHEFSTIFDSEAGIGFSTDFQRRTGDACTYLGNTLVTLATLSFVYDLDSPDVGLIVVSGDDSLIGTFHSELPREREILCSTLFNFETKFPHNQPFICSKFLVEIETTDGRGKVVAVPSPIKLLMKLGPKSMNKQLFPAWVESIKDYAAPFRNAFVAEQVCNLASYRFGRRCFTFLLPAISEVLWMLSNPNVKLKEKLFLQNSSYLSNHCHDRREKEKKRNRPRARSKR
ncbi:RNA polymerase [Tea plant line pattern virus]|uniref:RNA polymerase n=1 Tax=Tea plant line pattern virus TaxID=2419940 RepID=UPI000EB78B61|nr:RNA polymerase [Tea plant line pattern virus]AYE53925.1 RNA polymerase [Tea plant line pattern virus]